MSTNSKIIAAAVIVALIAGIPLYLQNQRINELSDQVAQLTAAKPAPMAAKNSQPIIILSRAGPTQVVVPSLPPAVVREPTADEATAAQAQAVQRTLIKAATNNLRILASSAQQYMGEKGVTEASFFDLVGTGTDNYVRSVAPAVDEDYSDMTISQTQTQVSISSASFGLVTFNL